VEYAERRATGFYTRLTVSTMIDMMPLYMYEVRYCLGTCLVFFISFGLYCSVVGFLEIFHSPSIFSDIGYPSNKEIATLKL
jgi:hypothetical protein